MILKVRNPDDPNAKTHWFEADGVVNNGTHHLTDHEFNFSDEIWGGRLQRFGQGAGQYVVLSLSTENGMVPVIFPSGWGVLLAANEDVLEAL